MSLKIIRLDGTEYSLKEHGLLVEEFIIDSPFPRTPTEILEGRSGFIDMGTVYEGRTMTAKLGLIAKDAADYPLLRNKVFRILDSREHFYLISEDEPSKRWLVKSDGFSISKVLRYAGKFVVTFVSPSPYSESVGTTLNPEGMTHATTNYGDPPVQYSFDTTQFSVWNDGDERINPRQHKLAISFKGASTNLKIKNITTNEEWQYTGTTVVSDTILLEGVRAAKNALSIFGNTNRKLITLVPGFNDFVISGTTGSIQVSFDFRFLYV
jgi:Phage tail protein